MALAHKGIYRIVVVVDIKDIVGMVQVLQVEPVVKRK